MNRLGEVLDAVVPAGEEVERARVGGETEAEPPGRVGTDGIDRSLPVAADAVQDDAGASRWSRIGGADAHHASRGDQRILLRGERVAGEQRDDGPRERDQPPIRD